MVTPLTITIAAINPPFDADHGVLFGLQSIYGVENPVLVSESTDFLTEIEVRTSDNSVDFAGDHLRRGDRSDWSAVR